ncbi:uncharacterized protein K452DRAFT_222800 [Aplosporella prunicola CBS 121167]|uniref:Zn(2)-C6 fungal-type domain-containing protein n=1 Tax=Aplosporella prunicola CBS 121167 TaxID=1176127 RepID=A0A6A6BL25_9PEZI|nr:uncharacterized protein K452DRAFT_222800 [Aplosporella prunicola CBS 121167]KAF2144368.1 hypothetical protein K452DRAFT_222800 [Aplosporella prunicola CBS 121167]
MGPPEGTTTSTPQVLSKTCQNCFHLKIRCVKHPQRDACDRCIRLNKHCVFRPARRRRNSAKRDVRIEVLEAQVQQLLQSQQQQQQQPSTEEAQAARPAPNQLVTDSTAGDVVDSGIISPASAERLLRIYRAALTPHFPFVVVPPDTAAEQLRRVKPFLFLAIMTAALFDDMPTQRRLGEMVKKAVNERILSDSTLTLDMLQGLLVFLAWSQYHPRPRRYTQYMQLAISIVIDSRLDRKPVSLWKTRFGSSRDPPTAPNSLGSDEQRAFLGCFYLASSVSKLLHKHNPLPYSKYMEDCCLSLRERDEYPADTYLHDLVRLQHIIERTEGLSSLESEPHEAKALISNLRSELETFRARIASSVGGSTLLLTSFYTAEVFLCQEAFFTPTLPLPPPQKQDLLCAGLLAAHSFLAFYFSLPAGAEVCFNNSEWIQVSYVVTLASRFAIASTDKSAAASHRASELRHALDLPRVLQRLQERIGSLVTAQVDDAGERDIFFYYQQRGRRIQAWFERSFAPAETEEEGGGEEEAAAAAQTEAPPPTYAPQAAAAAQSTIPPLPAYAHSLNGLFTTTNNDSSAGSAMPLDGFDAGTAGPWQGLLPGEQYGGRMADVFPDAAEDFMFSDWWPWMHP